MSGGGSRREPCPGGGTREYEPTPDTSLATHYDGPVVQAALRYGSIEVQLVRPDEPDRLLNDPRVRDLNQSDDYMPYWAYLWPGAYLLAEALASASWRPGTQVLEIGCGLGLAGLVALKRGCQVHFTDYDRAAFPFVHRSALASGIDPGQFTTAPFDWREPAGPRYPVILGADVLYERRLVPMVVDVLKARLSPGGEAWLAGPYRTATEDLPQALTARGLWAQAQAMTSRDLDSQPVRGTLHRIRHASQA